MLIQKCNDKELLRKMYLSSMIQTKRIIEGGKKPNEVDMVALVLEQLRIKLRLEELAEGLEE